jgi:hypothetical protein
MDHDGVAFAVTCEDGHAEWVIPDRVGHVHTYEWGDGINGGACEVGLVLDGRVRLRGDVWRGTLRPLVTALEGKTARATTFTHPDEGNGYLFLYAVLGAALDLVLLAAVLAVRAATP